jgi:integrase/recombinase XerD
MKTVIAQRVIHGGINRVSLRFPYDADLIKITRGFQGSKWSRQMNCWHVADTPDVITLLLKAFQGKAYIDYSAIKRGAGESRGGKSEEDKIEKSGKADASALGDLAPLGGKGREDIEKFRKWMESHRYPETTIRTYTAMASTFLRFIAPKEPGECTSDDLVRLVDEYILPAGLSQSYQNQMVSAVKKFYGKIYRSVIDPGEFTRPRPQHRLPNVLSKEEVKRVIEAPVNEKHRVMLSLVYACGLRRSELIALILPDLQRDRRLLRIIQSKGFKDRVVPVSEKVIGMIDTYLKHYKPIKYLFEGQYSGNRYSASSLDKVFTEAVKRAGLKREVTLHGLRHSYATHLLESGTDLRYIQELLGHKSSRTTEIYTHVTTQSIQKIRSPFDDL